MIIVHCAVIIVWAAREGVGTIGGSGFVDYDDVVIAKCEDVAGDAAIHILGCSVILEILVVGDNHDMVGCTHEKVAPMFESTDDGKEFSVPDRVISLCLGKGF